MRETLTSGRSRRVLVIGGTTVSRVLVESILTETTDFVVVGALSSDAGLATAIDELRPDLVIIDLCMTQLDGVAVLAALGDCRMLRKVILSKEPVSDACRQELTAYGASAFFVKKEVANAHASFRDKISLLFDGANASGSEPEKTEADLVVHATCSAGDVAGNQTLSVVGSLRPRQAVTTLPPIEVDEELRLTALRVLNVANLAPDKRLDAIVRHLCHVSGYPMSAVNLIDGSMQWTKAAYGFEKAVTPRAAAICDYTIKSATPFIVSDTLEHPVFSSYECVVGSPFIRSYVGVPLLVECGLPIGALCLLDRRPRLSYQTELRLLNDMADLIVQMLDYSWNRAAA